MSEQLETTWEETRERPDTSKCSRQQNKLNKTLTNFRNTSSRGGGGGVPSGGGILPYTEAVSSDRQQSRSGTRQGRVNIQQKQQDQQETKGSCFNMSGQGFFMGCEKTIEEGVTLDKYFGSGFQVLQVFGEEQEGSEKKNKKSQSFQQQQRLQQGSAQGGLIHETEEEYSESNKQSRVDLGVKSEKFQSDQKQQEDFSLPTQESQRNSSLTKEGLKRKEFSLTGEHAVIQKKLRQKQLMKPSSNSSTDRGNEQPCRVVYTSKVEQLKPSQQVGQQQQQQQQQYPQCLRLNRQIVAAKQQQQQQQQSQRFHNQPIQNLSPLQDSVSHIKTQEATPIIHKHNPSAVLNYQQISSMSDYNDLSFARRKNNSSLHQEVVSKQQPQINEINQAKPSTPFSTSRRKQFYHLKSKADPSVQGMQQQNTQSFMQPQSTSFLVFSKQKENPLETEDPCDEWSASQNEKNGTQMQETKGSSFLDACKGSSFMDAGKYSSYLDQSDNNIDRTAFLPAPSGAQKQFSIRRVTNNNNNSLHDNNNNNTNQILPYSSKVPLTHSPYIKEHQPLIGHSRKLSREIPSSLHYNSSNNPNNLSNQIRGGSMQQSQQQQQYNYQLQSQGDCSSLSSCQQTQTVTRKNKKIDLFETSDAQDQPQQRIHSTSFYHPSNILNTQDDQEFSGEDLRYCDNGYNSKNSQENNSKSALNAKKIITKNSYKDAIQNTQLSEDMDVSMRRTAKENKFIGQKDKFKQIIKKQDAHFLAKYAARFNLNNRECNL